MKYEVTVIMQKLGEIKININSFLQLAKIEEKYFDKYKEINAKKIEEPKVYMKDKK